MKKSFWVILIAFMLTACGQMGALYLPKKNQTTQSNESSNKKATTTNQNSIKTTNTPTDSNAS